MHQPHHADAIPHRPVLTWSLDRFSGVGIQGFFGVARRGIFVTFCANRQASLTSVAFARTLAVGVI